MDGLPEMFRLDAASAPGLLRPAPFRRTLKASIGCVGVGLHSGARVSVTLRPAASGSGVAFRRTDLANGPDGKGVRIPARFDRVADTRLCTVLAAEDQPDARVGTVEHLMAALAAAGVDDALVDVDGPELPVLDGSAAPWLFLLECAGTAEQATPRGIIEILRPVRVEDGPAFAELRPALEPGFHMALSIAFDAPAIGRQALSLTLTEAGFRADLARARTFTLREEIEAMHAAGLARGGSLDNAVVVDGAAVMNPAGLRWPDEFVRHKLLDAVGDLALAGSPIQGRFLGHRSGHALNNRLLRALFADPAAWRLVQPSTDAALPWQSAATGREAAGALAA